MDRNLRFKDFSPSPLHQGVLNPPAVWLKPQSMVRQCDIQEQPFDVEDSEGAFGRRSKVDPYYSDIRTPFPDPNNNNLYLQASTDIAVEGECSEECFISLYEANIVITNL